MKLRKLLLTTLCLCMVLALCACGGKSASNDGANSSGNQQAQTGQDTSDPSASTGVNFGLQTAPDPDFDSPATGDDSGKLYTIVGDYAYELDPATLQPIGDPLDPVTHLPVSNPVLDGSNPSTPNNPQDQTPAEPVTQPDPEPVTQPEPVTTEPTQETKLPNTGMFLEDD